MIRIHYDLTDVDVWSDTAVDVAAILHVRIKSTGQDVARFFINEPDEVADSYRRSMIVADKAQEEISAPATPPDWVGAKAQIELLPTV